MAAPVDVTPSARPDLVITRELSAPRDLVWAVWTDPAHLAKWWGPHRFSVRHAELELRRGGAWRIDMVGPDGQVIPALGTIDEATPPERLVLTTRLEADGAPFVAIRQTITLESLGDRTRLTLHARVVFETPAAALPLSGMQEGWSQTLDRMASYATTVASEHEMVVTRRFQAAIPLVWGAWASAAHLEKWWGPAGFTTTTERFAFTPGGEWAHVMHGPDGTDYPNVLTYQEIVPEQRITYSQQGGRADGEPMHLVGTIDFEPDTVGTRLTMRLRFASATVKQRVRDEFGAYEGAHETLDRLADRLDVA